MVSYHFAAKRIEHEGSKMTSNWVGNQIERKYGSDTHAVHIFDARRRRFARLVVVLVTLSLLSSPT